MPVAVVALAAGSFAAGATAFVAASTLAASIAAGAVMVGSALTIVGTITGNAKLTRIGAIVGIAGGIGTMMTSAASAGGNVAAAGAGDAASSVATDAATEAAGSAAGDAAANAGASVQTFGVPAPGASEALSGTANSGGGMLDMAGNAGASANGTGGMLDAVNATPGVAPATDPLAQAAANPTSAFDAGQTAAGQSANSAGNAFDPGNGMMPANDDVSMMAGSPQAVQSPGMVQQISSWAKANPELAKMALSAAGTMAGNLMPSDKDKAMMAAYKAQTDQMNRRARWGSGRI